MTRFDKVKKEIVKKVDSGRLFLNKKKEQKEKEQRYLEIFAQLIKLKEFQEWMKTHIEIHDQINQVKKSIITLVMYKKGKQAQIICPHCNKSFSQDLGVDNEEK